MATPAMSRKRSRDAAEPNAPGAPASPAAPVIRLTADSEQRLAPLQLYADMWRSGELCDVVLSAENEKIRAHRLILAGGSSYMRSCFSSGMRDGEAAVLTLQGVTACSLRCLLDFLYLGECEATPSSIVPLMHAASLMEVRPLLQLAADFLGKDGLLPESYLNIIELCDTLDRPETAGLRAACLAFVSEHLEALAAEEQWRRLPRPWLRALLESEAITLPELCVFQSAIAWLEAQPQPQRDGEACAELLGIVRYATIPADTLVDAVEPRIESLGHAGLAQRLLHAAFRFSSLSPARQMGEERSAEFCRREGQVGDLAWRLLNTPSDDEASVLDGNVLTVAADSDEQGVSLHQVSSACVTLRSELTWSVLLAVKEGCPALDCHDMLFVSFGTGEPVAGWINHRSLAACEEAWASVDGYEDHGSGANRDRSFEVTLYARLTRISGSEAAAEVWLEDQAGQKHEVSDSILDSKFPAGAPCRLVLGLTYGPAEAVLLDVKAR